MDEKRIVYVKGNYVEGNNIETGDRFYDQAQQLIQTLNTESSKENMLKLLASIQEGITGAELPEDLKEEVATEVKSVEIEVKKETPNKPKLVERLKNAYDALTGMENLGQKAVAVGMLLTKVIEWAEKL